MSLLAWDADAYDMYALPHERWGLDAIRRLDLVGAETVLDFGCGTGRDAERLVKALPNGRVIAVDGSPLMLTQLRRRLGAYLDRVDVVQADLRERLPFTSVDAVLSVATLHWLPDHATVFRNIAHVLRSGGRLAAETGGAGNAAGVQLAVGRAAKALDCVLTSSYGRRNFVGVKETARNLTQAGFHDIHVELVPEVTTIPADRFLSFLSTVMLVPELSELPFSQRGTFVNAVAHELGEPSVDWVRLRITATRS